MQSTASTSILHTPLTTLWARVHSPTGHPFPAVVSNLLFLGITRYRVDFLARTITSYASATHGYAVHIAPFPASHEHKFGSKWNEEKLVEAIRRAQRGEGNYIEFSKKVVEEAGVADYVAYLEGGRVVYFGEGGEERVEWFPGAKGAGEE